jgi:four helix bundle protein
LRRIERGNPEADERPRRVVGPPPHERLEAYRKALDAAMLLHGVATAIPLHRPDLRDQLNRASASVVLNLAEGAAEYAAAEKARFYRMSRRSAAECLAILDLIEMASPSPPQAGAARAPWSTSWRWSPA